MDRQLRIPFAECLRVESNFDEQNKFFGEQFQVSDIQMGWFHA